MLFFEWGVAVHDLDFEAIRTGTKSKKQLRDELKAIGAKARRQIVKDYIVFPALSGRTGSSARSYANLTANFVRNVWSNAIIFCGHFPDQAYTFTEEEVADETPRRLVRPPADRRRQHRRQPHLPRDERQPLLPGRAPPLPGHAEERVQHVVEAGLRGGGTSGIPSASTRPRTRSAADSARAGGARGVHAEQLAVALHDPAGDEHRVDVRRVGLDDERSRRGRAAASC